MTSNDYDRIEKIAFQLDSQVSVKTAKEIEKARSYKEGYSQAVADLLKVAKDHIGCADIPIN
jgi:hypothetical protein